MSNFVLIHMDAFIHFILVDKVFNMEVKSAKRPRKSNFTMEATNVIITEVEKNKKTLFSSFSNQITNNSKSKLWRVISQKVTYSRSTDEIRTYGCRYPVYASWHRWFV